MDNIATNIKNLRKDRRLSQDDLAQKLHVTRQTVSAWERGVSHPTLDTLLEIAKALDADEEQLLYGGPGKKPLRYRAVSLLPVPFIIPIYYVLTVWFFPLLLYLVIPSADEFLFIFAGQATLAVFITFFFCKLKDEIRNHEFYRAVDERDDE